MRGVPPRGPLLIGRTGNETVRSILYLKETGANGGFHTKMKRFTQALTTATAALLASAIIAPAANAATIDINDLTIECHVATAVARYHNQDAMQELKNYVEVSIRDLDFYASAKDQMRVLPKLDRSALMEAVLPDCRAHPDKNGVGCERSR
jgi:hypothetical protein